MRPDEVRAGASLAAIFGLRMLGLFLILPVFAVHAKSLRGGDDVMLAGLALGAYGLTQGLLQIPFGIASDRLGRKRVIAFGLLLFAAGSLVAGLAHDIWMVILGRVLQGAGAISAAVTALAADLTRDQHRTKVMAMIGSTIGLVFAGSLVAGPALYAWIGMAGIFFLTGALALGGIVLLRAAVPDPAAVAASPSVRAAGLREVLRDSQLLRLDFGIFTLHTVQMAMWIVVPAALLSSGGLALTEHWKVYLPVVLASFVVMVPAIIAAERRGRMRRVFLGAIALLLFAQFGFAVGRGSFAATVGLLLVFFVAFNVLEASLPSLVSRIAPAQARGAALGIYNGGQSLGAFVGGALGGALVKFLGPAAVFAFSGGMVALWLAWAWSMRTPPVIVLREYAVKPHLDIDAIREQLAALPGVREAVVVPEKRMAYLKVNLEGWDERRAHRLLGTE